jgi:hypothetical protein
MDGTLKRRASYHLPLGSKGACKKEMANASPEKIAHLIKICDFLMQTKRWRMNKRLPKNNGHGVLSARDY